MEGIFISYRRNDTQGWAGRIQEGLRSRFGEIPLFFDLQTIAPGQDFVGRIDSALVSCRALLALIGPRWLDCTDAAGLRRLERPDDYVRLEIATALSRNVLVIPVLLGGARMPASDELPNDLAALGRRNAHELSDKRWTYDLNVLVSALASETGFTIQPAQPAQNAAATGTSVQVADSLVLNRVFGGSIVGVDSSEPTERLPEKVKVASQARIEHSTIGDIVGIRHQGRRKN